MDKNKQEYVYLDSSNVEHKINISKEDFALAKRDEKIHDVKFKTKPTTFLKDAIKRFSKNKSSVAGGIILGTLLLMSLIIPFADTADIDTEHPEETLLEAKLFSYNGGFWDGSRYMENISCDASNGTAIDPVTGETLLYPNKDDFPAAAVKDLTAPRKGYLSDVSRTATSGFANIINEKQVVKDDEEATETTVDYNKWLDSQVYSFNKSANYDLEFTILNESIEGYSTAKMDVQFIYTADFEGALETTYSFTNVKDNTQEIPWVEGTFVDELETEHRVKSLKFEDIIGQISEADAALPEEERSGIAEHGIKEGKVRFLIYKDLSQGDESVAFKEVKLSETIGETTRLVNDISFTEAAQMVSGKNSDYNYWATTGVKRLYHGIGSVCNFRFDTYEAAYGVQTKVVGFTEVSNYIKKGWISEEFNEANIRSHRAKINDFYQSCKTSLTEGYCPIISISRVDFTQKGEILTINFTCEVYNYRYLGYETMPVWLFGTDKHGKDMLKQVFVGLRTSLALGLMTFAICFSFGLVYGSISGYFGGTVDLILERFTDILSGVPWIVVMTLCILNLGSSFFVFILAMCLTGWIGTAALTRTQFYRYRDREYTLACRTLGARDARLIFKHILPNAMGTIITSSVLMIPSVIFSEATLSYLGLGFNNLHSLGVILSDNQAYLSTYPILIIFPSIIMALIMISFNLFGNGLRDAFNPSLKGSD